MIFSGHRLSLSLNNGVLDLVDLRGEEFGVVVLDDVIEDISSSLHLVTKTDSFKDLSRLEKVGLDQEVLKSEEIFLDVWVMLKELMLIESILHLLILLSDSFDRDGNFSLHFLGVNGETGDSLHDLESFTDFSVL